MIRIRFDNSQVRLYGGEVFTFNGVLPLPSDRLTLLTGDNGSGKTLTLSCVASILSSEGIGPINTLDYNRIHVTGIDNNQTTRLAWLRQEPSENFISKCSADEIILPLLHPDFSFREAQDRLQQLMRTIDVSQALLERPISQLSLGERQLIAAAASLAPSPTVGLFDEPLANLDSTNSRQVLELISSVADHTSLLIATHNPAIFYKHLPPKTLTCHSLIRTNDNRIQLNNNPDIRTSRFTPADFTMIQGGSGLPSALAKAAKAHPATTKSQFRIYRGQGSDFLSGEALVIRSNEGEICRQQTFSFSEGLNLVAGDNASGKTHFLQTLSGDIPLNPLLSFLHHKWAAGHIEFERTSASPRRMRRNGASVLLPAEPRLWLSEETVEEELRLFNSSGIQPGQKVILDKLNIPLNQQCDRLSYGQKKVVTLLSLPNSLELVLLDEPFSDLSHSTTKALLSYIGRQLRETNWRAVAVVAADPRRIVRKAVGE